MNKKLFLIKANRGIWRFVSRHATVRNLLSKALPLLTDKLKDSFVPLGDNMVCLPEGGLIKVDQQSQAEKDMVLPIEVVDHFIEKSSYRAVMNFCLCRDANKCQDYPVDLGCLFLGEAAKNIHSDVHRSVTKEEARAHVRRYREAGLVNIIGRAKFDSIMLDAAPHDKLMTICGCCPCCCITRALPFVPSTLSDFYQKMPGICIQVSDNCIGCGTCVDACIYDGIVLDGDVARVTDSCRACGRCVRACPNNSLKISVTDATYVQQTIAMLSQHIDVS